MSMSESELGTVLTTNEYGSIIKRANEDIVFYASWLTPLNAAALRSVADALECYADGTGYLVDPYHRTVRAQRRATRS